MNISEKYVQIIWKKKSFSEAAKAMFVSQPALSSTIAKLENQLGFKIFDRSTVPISLTLRGRIYMDYLEAVGEQENILKQRLSAVNDLSAGTLGIGGNSYSTNYILPVVCAEFHRQYPNINITIDTEATHEKFKNGTLDIVFTYAPDMWGENAVPFFTERMIVAVSKKNSHAHQLSPYALSYEQIVTRNIPKEKEIEDLSLFANLPFIKTGKASNSDKMLTEIFPDHKVSPCIVINAKTFEMRYRMMREEMGALLVSDSFITNFSREENDVDYFALKTERSYRTLFVVYRKDPVEHQILNQFISTAFGCYVNQYPSYDSTAL